MSMVLLTSIQEKSKVQNFDEAELNMATELDANILSGKKLSNIVKSIIKEEIGKIKETCANFKPGLSIVQVGDREDSNTYVRMKIKTATELGMDAKHVKVERSKSEAELLEVIQTLNQDQSIHGIIVQLPLDTDKEIDSTKIINSVLPEKDVDCLHDINAGKLARGDLSGFLPCTPRGCMKLIEHTGIAVEGKRAVVIGRSKIVGLPMASLLTWSNATVTICHSKTTNLEEIVRQGDIIVAACGKTELVKGAWIKKGAVVIDCGINFVEDSTRKNGRRLVGDVEYNEAKKIASWITPVPGGVGPMTVIMLMQNTLESAKKKLL